MGIRNRSSEVAASNRTSLLTVVMIASVLASVAFPASADSVQDASQLVDKERPAISYCSDKHEPAVSRRLLFVTTLDGRLSALDVTKGGELFWSISTGPGPLISSSIHRLELTNNGRFVRMIPSLSGGIYKFDGESIDPIPITTENLLSSSAKFSDDLVISGGKETRTYGVSVRTGQLLYECSMHGCINATDAEENPKGGDNHGGVLRDDKEKTHNDYDYVMEHDPLVDDVMVVRRQTQTVRAVESRTGIERWNFSVGQHELDLKRPTDCHGPNFSDMDMAVLDLEIKVIVPEGVICAFSKTNPTVMLWKYKFDHPIVSAWRIGASDELEAIDLFDSARWLWTRNNAFETPLPSINPSIYLGMYEKQLYIQESISLRKEIVDQSNLYTHLTAVESKFPKIPWRPLAANSHSLVIVRNVINEEATTDPPLSTNSSSSQSKGNELVPYDDDIFAVSAQSVLNASEYVNGNGFYLYTSEDLNQTNNEEICNTIPPALGEAEAANKTKRPNQTISDELAFNLDDFDAPVKVVILSIWFWWKEIAVIVFTSAVLLNILIGQRRRGEREIVVIERHIPVPTAIEATESSTVALLGLPEKNSTPNISGNCVANGYRTISESTSNSGEQFSSRFQSDFDMLRCLGRGGFGVVFEAKNKLDDCKYAIKRITLPNREESRVRVMREVKTLANCEHHNIVRYFQSWVEKPPPGWQEQEDSKWLALEMSTSIQIETPESGTMPSLANGFGEIDKKKQLEHWMASINSTACSSNRKTGGKDFDESGEEEEEEDEDSCIIFRTESESLALREEDDDVDVDVDVEPTRKSQTNAISIDMHSNASELNVPKNGEKGYSQLSDSFQIEFVRSANLEETSNEPEPSATNSSTNGTCSKARRRHLSLDISSSEHNNNNNNVPAQKPLQNKVYLYIQMQLCRKESLRDWLRDNRLEDRSSYIGSIFHQIVDAVDYVHYKGLIHRDLKPSNIFFSQDGQIKIGDFGLVTDMADIPNMVTKCGDKSGLPSCSRHTQQVGTHLYMSPEQLRGRPYDYKVDIYSLGLIFFELLVYFGTEMERIVTLRALRDGHYPKEFPQQHPSEYALLKLMLSAHPEERPTTQELKQQLNEILKPSKAVGDSEAAHLGRSRTVSTCD